MVSSFRAFVVNKTDAGFEKGVKELTLDELLPGNVVIKVAYSAINYKDGLASIPNGNIVRKYPFIPGIDISGTIVESADERFKPGDEVLATSFDLGVSHFGGYSDYARIKSGWVVALPAGLNLKEAMVLGTAGFTAAQSIHRMEAMGLTPASGSILVTGATGGVGTCAIAMLAKLGYTVAASTGKAEEADYLKELGANEILSREEVSAESVKPLEKERWAGSIDSVGGSTMSYLTRTTKYGGMIAAVGLTGGTALNTTVLPFILRGVNLLGIDSAQAPIELRRTLWQRMATDLKPAKIDPLIYKTIGLDGLSEATDVVLKGGVRGRYLVEI